MQAAIPPVFGPVSQCLFGVKVGISQSKGQEAKVGSMQRQVVSVFKEVLFSTVVYFYIALTCSALS
jgi:hypothetical protein